jgi:hypothetical protein
MTRSVRLGSRSTRRGIAVSAAGALAAAAALSWQSAHAGFNDTTAPLRAVVGTSTVAVTNEIEGYTALTLPRMRPGIEYTECLIVTSTGSAPAQVRLYAKGKTGSVAGLTNNVTFSWTAGTGGGANQDCAGFVSTGPVITSTVAAFATTYADGYLPWDTAGGAAAETRTYRFTYSLSASAPVSLKGATASFTFVWEAQQR